MDFGVSRVISRSFEMVKERFGPLLGLWMVFFIIQIVFFGIFAVVTGFGAIAGAGLSDPGALGAGMILWLILFYVAYLLLYCAQSSALSAMASPLLENNFGDAFGRGMRGALPLFGVFILLIIAYFIVAIVMGLVGGLLSMLGTAGSVLFAVLVIPVMIYLACRLSVISPVVAVEKVSNPITAIARTWNLTRGNVLGIFLTLLVLGVGVAVLLGLMFFGAFSGMSESLASGGTPPIGGIIGFVALFFLASIFLAILGAAFVSVIHEELAGSTEQNLADTFG